jgi:hypothetical protein
MTPWTEVRKGATPAESTVAVNHDADVEPGRPPALTGRSREHYGSVFVPAGRACRVLVQVGDGAGGWDVVTVSQLTGKVEGAGTHTNVQVRVRADSEGVLPARPAEPVIAEP